MSDAGMFGFWAATAGLFGLVFGSFLNVVIHRLPRGEAVHWPGSHCPSCSARIPWYLNLPVVSWLVLRGRCRSCRGPIALRYLVVELMSGAVLVLVWLRFGNTPAFLIFGAYALALLALFWPDFEHYLLPNKITYPGIAVGLGWSLWSPLVGPTGSVIGAVVGYGSLWALARAYEKVRGEEGMGGGDFKLAAMIGAFSGVEGLLQVLLIASFVGSFIGIGMMVIRRGTLKSMLPFGCFLTPAALAIVLFDVSTLWQRWQEYLGRNLWGLE